MLRGRSKINMVELSAQIETPKKNINTGITIPTLKNTPNNKAAINTLINIHHSREKPELALIAVKNIMTIGFTLTTVILTLNERLPF